MTTALSLPGHIARIVRFTVVMHKPHYVVYGIAWVLAVEGSAALVSRPDESWRPTWQTAVRAGVITIVLLYLRMVDEQKDLEYDRVNNPDRPLVTGAVSAGELRAAMAVIAFVSTVASAVLSWSSALLIALSLGYGLALWGIEQASDAVRRNVMVNLVVTYPVQLWLTAYVVGSAISTDQVRWCWQSAAVTLIFAGAFLQFEFARKTVRTRDDSQVLYSNALGANGSALAVLLFAALAVGSDILLVRPWDYNGWQEVLAWVPLVLLAIPVYSYAKFVRGRREAHPLGPPVIFVLTLYAALIAQAVCVSR